MIFAQDIHHSIFNPEILLDEDYIEQLRSRIKQGDIYIFSGFAEQSSLPKIKDYLINVGRNSLPNYYPIDVGSPNFHRLNRYDERAYVKGCFHQFVFYPWNQDIFNLFQLFRNVYRLKNRISGLNADAFMGPQPEKDCIARLAFQHYPSGGGMLNRHSDPVDYHQLTVPTMMISKKGEDFFSGGAYVVNEHQEKICLDDHMNLGDVVFFNAEVVHGVDEIDPDHEMDWLSFKGRWMLLFAVNKLSSNTQISSSQDHDHKKGV